MTRFQLPRNPDGSLNIPGRVVRQLTWPFISDSSVPSGLSDTSGSGSSIAVSDVSAGKGGLILSSVNAVNAQVKTTQLIALASFTAIMLEAYGFRTLDSNVASVGLGIYGAFGGCYYKLFGSCSAKFAGGIERTVNVPPMSNNQGNTSRNLALLLLIRQGQAYLMEDDQVISNHDGGGDTFLSGGTVQPDVSITGNPSTTSQLLVEQLRLTLYSY